MPGPFLPQGQYDQQADFQKLDERMKVEEQCRRVADRIFYLSIPPSIFTTVAACASQAASSTWVAKQTRSDPPRWSTVV